MLPADIRRLRTWALHRLTRAANQMRDVRNPHKLREARGHIQNFGEVVAVCDELLTLKGESDVQGK